MPPRRRATSSRVATSVVAPAAANTAAVSAASAASSPAGSTRTERPPTAAAMTATAACPAGLKGSMPAVSIRTGAPSCRQVIARASVMASAAAIKVRPSSRVKAANCSAAPARSASAEITSGDRPCNTSRVASRATVNVLPAPGGPANTIGADPSVRSSAPNRSRAANACSKSPPLRLPAMLSGTPCQRSASRRAGSGGAAVACPEPTGSSAAVTSTPPAIRRVPRISASAPSSARTCAMAAATVAARKILSASGQPSGGTFPRGYEGG